MSSGTPPPADYGAQIAQNKGLQGQILGQAGNFWNSPLTGQLQNQAQSAWSTPLNNGAEAGQKASNAMYGQATSRLDPQFALQHKQLDSRLAAQGLADPTGEANQSANAQLGRQESDAYNQANFSSQILGGQEAQRMQGMDLQSRMAPLQAQQQAFQNQMMPLQAYNNLLVGQLGMQGQQYGQAQQTNNDTNAFWGQVANSIGQLAGSVGGAAMASDERLKSHVHRFKTEALPGVPWATWRWRDPANREMTFGVIAQDLQKVRPDLVHTGADGFLRVDYAGLAGVTPKEVQHGA